MKGLKKGRVEDGKSVTYIAALGLIGMAVDSILSDFITRTHSFLHDSATGFFCTPSFREDLLL